MIIGEYDWNYDHLTWALKPKQKSKILITIPHDTIPSFELDGFFKKRKNGCLGRDTHVWPIAKDIALKIPINIIRGFIPRAYVDFNRSISSTELPAILNNKQNDVACNDENLISFYKYYHKTIKDIIKLIISNFNKKQCLLLDFHGFKKQPQYGEYDIILGTRNRQTIFSDIDKKLANFLITKGYSVFLPQETPLMPGKIDQMSGQFTAAHYSNKYKINTIQIEIHSKFRVREGEKIGKQLANDFSEFLCSL